jgi:AcrR family transcriptional regulator
MLDTKSTGRRKITRRGGRPKAADVDKLNQHILAAAGDLFMQYGFDGTSMDAVAEKARISKRTIYLRHSDKAKLFTTVVYDLMDRLLGPLELNRYEIDDLGEALLAVSRDMVALVIRPEVLALYRLVAFEAQRRPDFGRWITDVRRRPAVQLVATILRRHLDELRLTDAESAAEQFMSLTVDIAARLGAFGTKMTLRQIDGRLKAAVDLFLNGAYLHDLQQVASSHHSRVAVAAT